MEHVDDHIEHGARLAIIVAGVSIAAVMQFLDITIVNVALPVIGGNLGATFDEIGWVITAYSLAAIAVIPLSGWFAIRFGRKRYFIVSIVGFTVASALCGLSSSFGMLLAARVLQGLFGGGMIPTAQAILVSSFARERQAVAQGIFGMIAVLGPGFGPTLGGWLTDRFSWPLIFFINVPLGVACVAMLGTTLREWPSLRRSVDVLGIALLVSGLAALQYFLERGEVMQWFDDTGIVLAGMWAVIGLVWFVVHALRVREPVLDLRTFRNRNLTISAIGSFAIGANLYGSLLVLSLYFQNGLGFTAMLAGLLLALRSAPTVVLAPIATVLLQRRLVPVRSVAVAGFALLALGTYMLGRGVTPLSDAGTFVPGLLVIGVAFAFLWNPLALMALRGLPPQEIGYGAAIFNLSNQIGGSFSIAAVTTLQDRRTAFWWDALSSGLNLRNSALTRLVQGSNLHDVAARLAQAVSAQAAVLSYRDVLFLLAIPPLVALPAILLSRRVAL